MIVFTDTNFGYGRAELFGISLRIGGIDVTPMNTFVSGTSIGTYFGETLPPGPADVEIRTPDATLRAPGAITFVAPANYETVLLPHSPGDQLISGAHGSLWRIELLAHNDSPYSVRLDVPMYPYTLVSPPPPDFFILPPETTANVVLATNDGPLQLRLPTIALEKMTFVTRIYDSRSGSDFGTAIPAVRERDFRRGKTTIPGVSSDDRFRATLRVFTPGFKPREFRVRVLTQSELQPQPWDRPPFEPVIAEVLGTYTLRTLADEPKQGEWTVSMGTLPLPAFAGNARIQVQIEPADATSTDPYWAYVSITNNDTQHVTLLTP